MDNQVNVPAGLVPSNFVNDPKTERIIFGSKLAEGMIILLESAAIRPSIERFERKSHAGQASVLELSRWARIIEVRRDERRIVMICEYADAPTRVRHTSNSVAWYVKLDSIPEDASDEVPYLTDEMTQEESTDNSGGFVPPQAVWELADALNDEDNGEAIQMVETADSTEQVEKLANEYGELHANKDEPLKESGNVIELKIDLSGRLIAGPLTIDFRFVR